LRWRLQWQERKTPTTKTQEISARELVETNEIVDDGHRIGQVAALLQCRLYEDGEVANDTGSG